MVEQLEKLSTWTNIYGWLSLISGVFSAISGLFFFIIGAIPGVMVAVLGWKLIQTSKSAKEATTSNEVALEQTVTNLATYFKVYVILTIVSLVIMILTFSIIMTADFSLVAHLSQLLF